MGKVVMYSSVSVDGFVADEHDQLGPLFDWLGSGDVPLDESGATKVSQTSFDYIRPYWDQIGVTIVGRHVFDLTDGWDGTPPPEGWDPEAPGSLGSSLIKKMIARSDARRAASVKERSGASLIRREARPRSS